MAALAARAATPVGLSALAGATGYAATYAGDRATMLFDVVDSNQHSYRNRVLRNVATFRQQWPGLTIGQLALGGPQFTGLGLTAARWQTVVGLAGALSAYQATHGALTGAYDDVVVAGWARSVEPVRLTPALDPFVGAVPGISYALFAYLRMRSGADAVKPDGRVRTRLQALGVLPWRPDPPTAIVACEALAAELGLTRLQVDQLLW